MDVNFELIKYFVQVVKMGSVSKASDSLQMTQSAISQAISNLEKQLNVTLFIRTSKGMTPTPEGIILYDNVKNGIRYFEEGVWRVLEFNQEHKFLDLRIASTVFLSKFFVFPKLNRLKEQVKDLKIEFFHNIEFSDTEQFVLDNKIDIAIVKNYGKLNHSALAIKEICKLNYVFFYNPDFFQFKEEIKLNDLKKYPLILKSSGTHTKQLFNKSFFNKFVPSIQVGHDMLIVDLVQEGQGIGFAPKEYLPKNLNVIPIEDYKQIQSSIFAITRKSDETLLKMIKLLK